MTIHFEDKNTTFDTVSFSWFIHSDLNDYRLIMAFCGAIDEENNEDIENASSCCISLNEVSSNKPYIMQTIKEKIEMKLSIELDEDNDLIYNTFPDWRDSIYYNDYTGFDNTIDILKAFIEATAGTLEINNIDIDNIIDYVA